MLFILDVKKVTIMPRGRRMSFKPLNGFTLVEIVVAVTVIAIVAGIGFLAIGKYRENSEVAKLKSDITSLNQAAQLFRVSGGSMASLTTPTEVLSRLKSVSSDEEAEYSVGFRGAMVRAPDIGGKDYDTFL
ncbi:MAG: prepilin-type N-terminal cleavage/methylation domain-containing protein [Verrucomicrobiales bacterium]|jgi:prepilin-type N-terminal cleavage/methylation domain-containing protein